MLVALDPRGGRVYGWDAVKGGRYTCPECTGSVLLKSGPIVIEHFAHRPDESCGYGEGESYQHMFMKYQMQRFWSGADLEVKLIDGHRADCVLQHPKGNLVVECQASGISVDEFNNRTWAYENAGIPVLWIWHFNLFAEHHPPREWRFRAATLEDASRRNYGIIAFRYPGILESWRLFMPRRHPEYVRRVERQLIADEGEALKIPRPWILKSTRTLWMPGDTTKHIPGYDDNRVSLERVQDHERWVWRAVRENGSPAYLGLFIDRDSATRYLADHGYELIQEAAST